MIEWFFMKRFVYFIFVLLFPFLLCAEDMMLRDCISGARSGDYVVLSHHKSYILFHVVDCSDDSLAVEEISVPQRFFKNKKITWGEWVSSGAPQHYAWIKYSIDMKDFHISECYSLSRQGWVEALDNENFLSTLLNLKFNKVSDSERRRVGVEPQPGATDRRSLWNPRLIYEGQKIASAQFTVWRAHWAKDGSELADKVVEIYLPLGEKCIGYFPYWLQVHDSLGSAYINVIDSGRNL